VQRDILRLEVNGQTADDEAIALLEHEGWGHFTAMQVRNGRTRGLDLHLERLSAAHRDIYGRQLDGDFVRAQIRHALDRGQDASVRVYGYWAGVIVVVRPPQEMPQRPQSMQSRHFQRPLARLKHVGSWSQGRFHDHALAAGFDESLLVDEAGCISEGTITNVGFWRDDTVIWPDGPRLDGITMLVLQRELKAGAVQQAEATVRLRDLAAYRGMILCNSRGWAPVGQVDEILIPANAAFTGLISAAYDACAWDEI
jgi:branched-subunit amino acid aminotransferase/4-amino-4-deoxychorismate lyase